MTKVFFSFCCLFLFVTVRAEDGYRLWLRYHKTDHAALLQQYRIAIGYVKFPQNLSPTLQAAKQELLQGLEGLLDKKISETTSSRASGLEVCLSPGTCQHKGIPESSTFGDEGFGLHTVGSNNQKTIVLHARSDAGVLYGVFHFLRLLQTQQSIQQLSISSVPKSRNRSLNHWDNLNRHVERGYAGISSWIWHTRPH